MREGNGIDGLFLYHADARAGNGTARVVRVPFQAELRSGRYRTAVVRRLHRPLASPQAALVAEFAEINEGRVSVDDQEGPCGILMANTSGSISSAYERLSCSEFVAMMLHVAGLVERTDVPRQYAAMGMRGMVLGAPYGLNLRSEDGSSSSPTAVTASSAGRAGRFDRSPSSRSSGDTSTSNGTPTSTSPRNTGVPPLPPAPVLLQLAA